jgi:hypothetical protein
MVSKLAATVQVVGAELTPLTVAEMVHVPAVMVIDVGNATVKVLADAM